MRLNFFTFLDVSQISWVWQRAEDYLNLGGPILRASVSTPQTLALESMGSAQSWGGIALKVGSHAAPLISSFWGSSSLQKYSRYFTLMLYTTTLVAFLVRTYFRSCYNFVEAKPENLLKSITWLTGSNSGALPILLRLQQPSLMPPSKLLKDHNLVPLSGEMLAINSHLSGVERKNYETALLYAQDSRFHFNQDYSLKEIEEEFAKNTFNFEYVRIHLLRLQLTGSLAKPEVKKRLTSALEQARQKKFSLELTPHWEKSVSLIGQPCEIRPSSGSWLEEGKEKTLCRGEMVIIRIKTDYQMAMVADYDVQRRRVRVVKDVSQSSEPMERTEIYKLTEEEHKKFLEKLEKASVDQIQKVESVLNDQQRLDQLAEFEKLMNQQVKVLSSEEMKFVQPLFPIIWASHTLQGTSTGPMIGKPGEHVIKQDCVLGKDIQVAFTYKEHIPTLKNAVGHLEVSVHDIELLKSQ